MTLAYYNLDNLMKHLRDVVSNCAFAGSASLFHAYTCKDWGMPGLVGQDNHPALLIFVLKNSLSVWKALRVRSTHLTE